MSHTLDHAAKTCLTDAPNSSALPGLNSGVHIVRITDARASGEMDVWVPSALRRVPESRMRRLVARHGAADRGPDRGGAGGEGRQERAAGIAQPAGRGCSMRGTGWPRCSAIAMRPTSLRATRAPMATTCEMLSMGGLCGLVVSAHVNMQKPTKLRLLGALADEEGQPLYLSEFALTPVAGRPQAAGDGGLRHEHGLGQDAHGHQRAARPDAGGRTAAAIKLTGTACCQDTWKMRDAGASPVYDFVDGGTPRRICAASRI